ncbi:Protein of unknown function [Parapedobacter composti]|uniref:DUF2851 domain-containing protein n=1 Tax=Parapedobacter composti TaxID=623281 RepID=A0A1I1KJF9_9SPHI|nr:DUF2851 family protein [Parapedobacter composti]SFC60412.1 Protein of unknown function [Parapedobacter composti]
MALPEDMLHFVWKYRLYCTQGLHTDSGKSVVVLETGIHNHDAGPDFVAARIRIDGTEWVGNVEIHVNSSDWNKHGHQYDRAYNNVVLHVVYEHDGVITRQDGTVPETLELKSLIPVHVLSRYEELMRGLHWIPCERLIRTVPTLNRSQWLSRLLIERFEHRVTAIFDLLTRQRGNWEETCYIWLARSFGFKVNAQAFEQLARSLPQVVLGKYKGRAMAIEALFFGQAGMLENVVFNDTYPRELQREYRYLRKLHGLSPMDVSAWKYMRTRPGNFPTLRIAQFAALCLRSTRLFSAIIDTEAVNALKNWFEDLPIASYWYEHYRFDGVARPHSVQLGKRSIDMLLINTIAGILFAYGKYIGNETYIYRAITLLENLKAEDNAIIRRFSALGVQAGQAAESQALLQMKTYYCDKRKCLDCGMGLQLIKKQ